MNRWSRFRLVLISVFIALLFSEIFLRIFFPIDDPYQSLKDGVYINQFIRSSFEKNVKFTTRVDEELPGIHGEHTFSTNNYGFRGDDLVMPKPENEYRIFLVGGSTMECFYLDDTESIENLMQQFLNDEIRGQDTSKQFQIYNAGKSGLRSDDHVALISQRLVHLQPDLIIVMCGLNDLRAAMHNFDYLHYDQYAYKDGIGFWRQIRMLSTEFQIGRRLQNIATNFSSDKIDVVESLKYNSDYSSKIKLQKNGNPSSEFPKTNLDAYRNNLNSIAGICKSNGVELIFCTQQTTWNSAVDSKCQEYSWMRYLPKQDLTVGEMVMDSTMNIYNNVMHFVAKKDFVRLTSTEMEMEKSTGLFYDDCHFNAKGAKLFAYQLTQFMKQTVFGFEVDSSKISN